VGYSAASVRTLLEDGLMAAHHLSGEKLMRRVAGYHDIRLDGIYDLILRAQGMSVMDVGCNRGMVGFEFVQNGAVRSDGVDNHQESIGFARELHTDNRGIDAQFEVADLTKGAEAFKPFGDRKWDIVLFLATYHKLRRVMSPEDLTKLVKFLASRTNRYFAWRGTDKRDENDAEIADLDRDLAPLKRVHTSYLSKQIGAAAIWECSQ
jgi:SAM-dependent methyltransferase